MTFAILAHVALLEALVLLLAWRSRTPFAYGLLALNVLITVRPVFLEWRYDRTVGPVTWTVFLMWVMAVIVTWWGASNGYL